MATTAESVGLEGPAGVVELLRQAHHALLRAAGATHEIGSLPAPELLEMAELSGAVQRLSDAVLVRTVEAVEGQCATAEPGESLAAQHGQRDAIALLAVATGASRRSLRKARQIAGVTAPRGAGSCGVLPPLMPHVAEAISEGTLGLDQAVVIRETLSPVAGRAHPDDLEAAECALVASAVGAPDPFADEVAADSDAGREGVDGDHSMGTRASGGTPLTVELLAVQARAWRDALDPDGPEPAYEEQRARRSFTFGQRSDGMWVGKLLLPADQGAALRVALDAHNAPRTAARFADDDPADAATAESGATGTAGGTAAVAQPSADGWDTAQEHVSLNRRGMLDTRSPAQRQADTLVGLVTRAIELADAPRIGGEAATLVITVSAEELRHHAENGGGTAYIEHTGDAIPAHVAARILCDGHVQAGLVDDAGLPLRLGRRRRTHTVHQRRAILLAYPGGCANPACDAPPGFTEIHHPNPWAVGGDTDVDNGVPLCQHCHTQVHSGHLRCVLGSDGRWTVATAVPLRSRGSIGLAARRPLPRTVLAA